MVKSIERILSTEKRVWMQIFGKTWQCKLQWSQDNLPWKPGDYPKATEMLAESTPMEKIRWKFWGLTSAFRKQSKHFRMIAEKKLNTKQLETSEWMQTREQMLMLEMLTQKNSEKGIWEERRFELYTWQNVELRQHISEGSIAMMFPLLFCRHFFGRQNKIPHPNNCNFHRFKLHLTQQTTTDLHLLEILYRFFEGINELAPSGTETAR